MTLAPYGITIFCDDIRHEVGNKTTFVGCYRNVMYFQNELPFVLPKFGIAVDYREPVEIPPAPVALKVFLPGDDEKPIVSGELVNDQMIVEMENQKVPEAPGDGQPVRLHHTTLMLSPLVIQQAGWIKVRAVREGWDTLRLGALEIQQIAAEQTNDPTDLSNLKK